VKEEGEVAESKRRGEDAVDEHLDEVFVDAVDDAPEDEALADDSADGPVVPASRSPRRSTTATKAVTTSDAKKDKAAKSVETSTGLYARIARFFREVVAELRKVNWPSRNELLTYTTVVIVFVVIMMSIVAGLDWGFGWLITHVFG
jgi:preprotein translocase subunit SecE